MSAPTARERLDSLLSGAIARYAPIAAPETPPAACSVETIETTEQPKTERPTCSPEQVSPPGGAATESTRSHPQRTPGQPESTERRLAPDSAPPTGDPSWRDAYEVQRRSRSVPAHKLERRTRRWVSSVLEHLDAQLFKYDWMGADHLHLSPAELEAMDAHRKRVFEGAAYADGSRLARLDGMLSPADQRISRLIRDDALYAETEWSKLARHDRLYANAVLEASWGLREDGTCARNWHAQRARSTFQIAWIMFRVGTTRFGDIGTLTVRGVSFEYLMQISAPPGKAALHRNTLAGTHRARSVRNEDVGYIPALENAGAFERFQYGDRSAEARQVNEYTLRVSTRSEKQAALIDRHEAAYRELMQNRWAKLAAKDALELKTGQQRALERKRSPDAREAEYRAEIQACTGPP